MVMVLLLLTIIMVLVMVMMMLENTPTTRDWVFLLMKIQISHVAGVEPTAEKTASYCCRYLGLLWRGHFLAEVSVEQVCQEKGRELMWYMPLPCHSRT